MKKFLILLMVLAFAALPVTPVFANDAYGNGPGCGLGGDLFKGNKGILQQVLAGTTNASIPPQSFAITTGTIGCTNNGQFASNEHAVMFANLNFDNLSQEMAQGGGEHLASLATLMGVPMEQQPEFFALTQEQYPSLMQAGKESPAAMIKALDDAIVAHPILAKVSLAR